MHLNIPGLANPKGAVSRQILNRRVPPAIEIEHMAGRHQVQSGTASFKGQQEDAATLASLKAFHHFFALCTGHAAMQEEHFFPKDLTQMLFQQGAHFVKLRENQGTVARLAGFRQHLGQTHKLSRTVSQRRIVPQELGRMITDLLQLRQPGQDQALTLDALAVLHRAHHLFKNGGVARGLFPCQATPDWHFQLIKTSA